MRRLALSFLFIAATAIARDVPELTRRVTDTAGILSPAAVERLEWTLEGHEKRTGNQVAVLTIESLEGESIEEYSMRVVEKWKLGQKGKDNGALLLVAQSDRKMRIEVGYGLEATLTDVRANRIIRNEMAPKFRQGDFDGGIEIAVASLLKYIEGPPETKLERATYFCSLGPVEDLEGRIVFGLVSVPLLGIFWLLGTLLGQWGLYFFLIPFFVAFPLVIAGPCGSIGVVLLHLILFPIVHRLFKKSKLAKSFAYWNAQSRGQAGSGSRSSSSWSSSSSRSSSSSSSFSGGGGSFGGGGSSGSW